MSRHHYPFNWPLIVLLLWLGGISKSWASVPAGISEYYVPVDEDNEWIILEALGNITDNQNMRSVISLTPWADNIVIYYDHWEDGYDFDLNNPTTADETCSADIGGIKTFESSVPRPRTLGSPAIPGQGAFSGNNCIGQTHPANCAIGSGGNTNYCYDGRDRIVVVGGGSTVVRSGWPQTDGVVTGLAEEVYPVTPQLTTYILPFGEDIYAANNARTDYRRVFVAIQATENTTFQVDFNHDGTFDALDCNYDGTTDGTQCALNKGEIYRLSQTSDGAGGPFATLNSGAIIQGAATLQVQYLNGDSNATYNSRATSAFPRGFWDDEYYAPVPSGTRNTDILLHNPHAAAISINWETRSGSGTFTLNAYESAFFQAKTGNYVPSNSGVYLKGSNVFWGVSDIDTNSSTYDWAYSLVPAYLLDNEQYLSWAPGCYDNATGLSCANTAANRNDGGVFITPAQDNTTVFVDRDNNGVAEDTYLLNRLQVQYVFDAADGDLTGAHIWATGPYVLAYGENPDLASTANPSLDAGYTTLPNPGDWMSLALTVDKTANPVVLSTLANPATTAYTLTVKSHQFSIDAVSITDTLAADWDYVAGVDTTTIILPDGSTRNTDPVKSGGSCGNDGGSCVLAWSGLGSMAPNQTLTIVFTARSVGAPNYASGALSQNKVTATATRTVGSITQTFKASNFAYNTYLDNTVGMTVTKTPSVAETTPLSPGDTLTYTINVGNPSSSTANLTGVALYDALPAGTRYVANSGSVTGKNYYWDRFSAAVYNNNAENVPLTLQWATQWFERGETTSPTADDIRIISDTGVTPNQNVLRVRRSNRAVARKADLSGTSAAILSFDYRRFSMNSANDNLYVQICANATLSDGTHTCADAGNAWTTIRTFNTTTDSTYQPFSYSIPDNFRTANFAIRFDTTGSSIASSEGVYFDNIQIAATKTSTAYNPPNFVNGYTIMPGESLSLVFNVTIDNPLPAGLNEIINNVFATASEIPIPISDDARNIIVNPTQNSAAVGDRIWLDSDGDGVLDAGETGLANVQVTLKDQWGTPLRTSITDTQGRYQFTGIAAGNGYYVEVVGGLPFGLVQTLGSSNRSLAFNLAAGQVYQDADIGYKPSANTAIIGDRVWSDADGDGLQDAGEPGLSGVRVRLYSDANGNQLIDNGETFVETMTGANGGYFFNVAATGTEDYIVFIDMDQAALSAYSLTTGNGLSVLNAASGGSYLNADFGIRQQTAGTTFSIADRVWLDDGSGGGTAGDGLRNGGETGIGGVSVDLLDASGNTIATTATDANGLFVFTGVPAGVRYSWRVTDQSNALANYYGTTLYAQAKVYQMPGTLSANVDHTAAPHFGYNFTRSIGDTVFNDSGANGGTAGNGVQDGGEAGISGVVVKLYNDVNGNGVIDAGVDLLKGALTTSANGKYLFSGLANGNYIVSIESPPGGYVYTGPADSDSSTAGQQRAASISGGGSSLNNDFGYRASAPRTLSGKIWSDVNNNGVDNSEAGLANISVELYADVNGNGVIDANETRIGVASTDSNGQFSFAALQGSGTEDYVVRITDQNGVLSGYTATFEKTEGASSPFNGMESVLDLNGDISDLNFGFYKPVPTYALISAFRAYVLNGQTWVEWSTLRERGTVGFFVERQDPASGEWIRLNGGQMLRGLIDSAQGGDYRFADPDARSGETWRYRLIERELRGSELTYGPWRVNVAAQKADSLPESSGVSATNSGSSGAEAWKTLGYHYAARAHRRSEKQRQPLKDAGLIAQSRHSLKQTAGSDVNAARALAMQRRQVRLRTRGEGLFRLDAKNISEIAALWGIDNLYPRFRQGRVQLDSGDGKTSFYYDASERSFYFVGNDYRTLETDENIYRLKPGAGIAMPVVKGKKPGPAVPGVFRDTQRFEENTPDLLLPWIHSDESADYWYWDYAMPPYVPSVVLTVQLPEPSQSGQGLLKIYLRGGSDEAVGDDREVTANMNGVPLSARIRWSGNTEAVLQTEFDQSILETAVNGLSEIKLQIDGIALNDAAYDLFLIDRVEIEYDRKMRAFQGGVWLHAVAPGVIGVDGFSGDKIRVIENPGASDARWRKDVAITADPAGGFQASFKVDITGDYLVTEAFKAVEIEADAPSRLKAKNIISDYLIIAPRTLAQGAMALADYRKRNYHTEIAWLDDIYDEFSFGRTDSAAVEAFLDSVYKNRNRVPRYVVLLGRGTFDHRDLLGYRESLIPLRLAGTPWGLAGSDNRYADVNGDKLPDYLLGRIAASNDEEALAYVDKLMAYEATFPDGWNARVALVADDPDDGGDFHGNSDQIDLLLQNYVDSYKVDKLYHSNVDVRTQLLAGWNEGLGYVNYIGHGGATQLASEGFMTTTDVNPATLYNGAKLPIFAALTCAAGDSAMPATLSLSDKLVLHPEGGAIAAFSPSGLSLDMQALSLNQYFAAALLGNREAIGAAAKGAHDAAAAQDAIDSFMHDVYQISGDPSVALR